MSILQTRTIIEINDKQIFEKEGKSYLDFALQFISETFKARDSSNSDDSESNSADNDFSPALEATQ